LVDGLPAWLPIGSDEILINWAVTNSPSWVGAGITYTNTAGEPVKFIPYMVPLKTESLDDFREWASYAGNSIIDGLRGATGRSQISTNSTIRFYASLAHRLIDGTPGGTPYEFISIYTNIGKIKDITPDTFRNMPLNNRYARIYIPGLNEIEIDVKDKHHMLWKNGVETYTYNGLANQADGFIPPKEMIITNVLTLRTWYSHYPVVRITLGTTNGVRRTYTGFGDPLDIKMEYTKSEIILHTARGSYTEIEWSEDLVNWNPYAEFQSTDTDYTFRVPVDPYLSRRFIRGKSH